MHRLTTTWGTALAVVALLALPTRAAAQDLEAVIEWHRLLQTTVASTPTPTVFFTRPYAMTSIAVFDAVNSIDRRYRGYNIEVDASSSASRAQATAGMPSPLPTCFPTCRASTR